MRHQLCLQSSSELLSWKETEKMGIQWPQWPSFQVLPLGPRHLCLKSPWLVSLTLFGLCINEKGRLTEPEYGAEGTERPGASPLSVL